MSRPTVLATPGALRAPMLALAATVAVWATLAGSHLGEGGPIVCPLRAVTGVDCPFCGSTRAAVALAHGDVVGGLDHNALFVVVMVPAALAGWVWWLRGRWTGRAVPVLSTRAVLIALGVTLLWWALRLAVPWLGSGTG